MNKGEHCLTFERLVFIVGATGKATLAMAGQDGIVDMVSFVSSWETYFSMCKKD